MRFIQKIDAANVAKLSTSKSRNLKLGNWTGIQIEDALSKRHWQDEAWRIALRQYEAIPDTVGRKRPYSEQLVLEIPIGAKQCDTIVSAMEELIFATSPVFTVRGSPNFENHAYAVQLLSDKLLLDMFTNFRAAGREIITDTVQMGTGVGTVVRSEEVSKHATFQQIDRGPRCYSIPPEDFVVPGGAYTDIDSMTLTGYRMFYNEAELTEAAIQNGWDITMFKPAGNVSWVRQRREQVAKTDESTESMGRLYEVFIVYAYYDYDEDGVAEDLYYVWDRTSRAIGYVGFAPYDSRPFVASRYQLRPHIFYGLGVLEMARPFQLEVTEWHNFKMANAHLANTRFWGYRLGAVGIGQELEIGPNKAVGFADPEHDLKEFTMADIYQSAQQYEAATMQMADQRVGVNELGGGPIAAGKRVPAATAMSILQQQNKRFAAPFNNVREAMADMMRQCILRMREQYLKGGKYRKDTVEYLVKVVGPRNSLLIEELFSQPSNDIRDYVAIEVTASSASINREADRQSAIALVSTLGAYYDKVLQMAQLLFAPQIPPPMKQMVMQMIKSSGVAIERLLRTFDTVRDPKLFLPDFINQMNDQGKGNAEPFGGSPAGESRTEDGTQEGGGGLDAASAKTTGVSGDIGPATPTEGQLTDATPID